MDNHDYFERFKRLKTVHELSRQLEDTCKVLDDFGPIIQRANNAGRDITPAQKIALGSLTDRYSSLLKELNEEFKKFPK